MRRSFEEVTTISDEAQVIIENAIVVPVDNTGLSGVLGGVQASIELAAQENVRLAIEQSGTNFSQVEIVAMTAVEAFRQVSGLDLTAVLLRAHYVTEIQRRNLLANHPGQYSSLAEMASDNGCSVSDLHATLDMVNVFFPYVVSELGLDLYDLWSRLGKSKIKELLPVLKALITGEDPDTNSTRNAVAAVMDDQYATMEASNPVLFEELNNEDTPEERQLEIQAGVDQEARHFAVEHLIEMGELLTNRQLRNHLRPQRTPPVGIYIVEDGDRKLAVADLDQDQLNVLSARMGERLEIRNVALPNEPRYRQAEAMRNPILRRVFRLFGDD